jgi:hypothetical protein
MPAISASERWVDRQAVMGRRERRGRGRGRKRGRGQMSQCKQASMQARTMVDRFNLNPTENTRASFSDNYKEERKAIRSRH